AWKGLAGLALTGLVIMTPLRKLVRPFLRQPGEGPDEAQRDSGWFDCKFIVEAEDGSKSVYAMHGAGDPGYKVTSKLVSEAALCLVEDADALPGGDGYGGVLTSASGLGQALIDRLSKNGIHFDGPL
ncbi:MAG: saccharopine dehydrogenase, partial [Alphaproteobacteria bacterium]|nr:saccharopine dehydrogenase [Alphaproteobacteria bacterium]